MDKLSVFSKKLGGAIDVAFNADGVLLTPEGVSINTDGILLAWNNSSGSWVDKGWNNSSGSWMDNGWNNSSGRWTDKGWSNSSGRWLDNGWSNSSGSWSDSSGGGSGCYITTACVEYMGLADDCHELVVLRKSRDRLVLEDESFRFKVLEYYRKAPLIVQCIEKDPERDNVLESLYVNMISRCVTLLEAGRTEEAKSIYLNSYEQLVTKYLVS